MRPKQKVLTACLINLLIVLSDGALTYLNTPDLANEGNPLVMVFGLGWLALFTVNAIGFAVYAAAAYYLFTVYKPPVVQADNMKEFISQLCFNRPDKFVWFFYKLPTRWKPSLALLSYLLVYAAPITRAVLVFEWLMTTFGIEWAFYNNLRKAVPLRRVDLALYFFVFAFLLCRWVRKEYLANRRACAAAL